MQVPLHEYTEDDILEAFRKKLDKAGNIAFLNIWIIYEYDFKLNLFRKREDSSDWHPWIISSKNNLLILEHFLYMIPIK